MKPESAATGSRAKSSRSGMAGEARRNPTHTQACMASRREDRAGIAVLPCARSMVAPRASFGFGLARSLDFHASLSTFTELCELLGREVGTVFYPHHALSYDALGTGLDRGELGLAWMPPIPAIEALD